MDKALDEALVEDFPILFGDRHADMRSTLMCWGFPGDGWEPIIRQLAEQLEPMIEEYWEGLDDEEREELAEFYGGPPRAVQVKEKFGTLRFYMTHYPENLMDEINRLIRKAEARSSRTCEMCGDFGVLRASGWLKTLCDDCAEDPPVATTSVQVDYAMYSREPLDVDTLFAISQEMRQLKHDKMQYSNEKWVLRRAIYDIMPDGKFMGASDKEVADQLIEQYG